MRRERLLSSGLDRMPPGSACHVPERNWTDNRTRGAAIAEVDRNTPTLMNLRLGHQFGWDGATDALWKQSLRPMLDAATASPRDSIMRCLYVAATLAIVAGIGSAPAAAESDIEFKQRILCRDRADLHGRRLPPLA